ncbi:Benzoylformate decarboxylase [Roseivivax jejudonensis]|uniref:Benzoylformate decarboxylase n=1 Tax=Roseivivax jejudonensis TaxID=1529041 RepID=A0A1X6ZWQ5_9RHOB|nr:thiamine pyrophosphate-binding protein [Roseivivax jejudonensis]SLN63904.1 Benzoylformate decarboxylase [Roseivivax jejudonensis]
MDSTDFPPPDWRAEPVEGPIDDSLSWGSDIPAAMLRRLGIPFIALTPGASYRGLHDSLVNHLGNERPEMLVCLHEEHAVAIAHGYAKATGRAMAVALHSNVGLMHGTMAIFNAFADRAPMLILGATGPMDATERRPWIDWLHTTQDQAALVRHFIKWDDQPASALATPEAMLRGWKAANTAPGGPVYINLDASDQEAPLPAGTTLPDPARYAPPADTAPDPDALDRAVAAISRAARPVLLFGRGARTEAAMDARVALAERLGAPMLSDLKTGAMVPTTHPLHAGPPFNKLSAPARAVLEEADLIVSLGWTDLGGLLKQAYGTPPDHVAIVHASLDHQLHSGWNQEHFALPPVDVELAVSSDSAVAALLAALPEGAPRRPAMPEVAPPAEGDGTTLTNRDVARALKTAADGQPITFSALARGFPVDILPHTHPLDYLGKDGGGGIGSGPGLTIGAALALRDSGRLVVGSLGDGDTLMSINALWTAAKYRIPALFLVANNRSYFNDELHQENVARVRGRNPANAWVGQRIDGPAPDLAALARGQGVEAIGPVTDLAGLEVAMQSAVATLRAGRPCLVDVHIDPRQGREKEVKRNTKGAA